MEYLLLRSLLVQDLGMMCRETTTGFDFETVGERGMVGASDTVVKKFEFGSACSSNYPEMVPFNHGTIQ
jgi:hypothetical protein